MYPHHRISSRLSVGFFATLMAYAVLFCSSTSLAQNRTFGLGVVLGSPTAITGKLWLDSQQAVDIGLNYNFDSSFTLYADYQRHWKGALANGKERFLRELAPYVGIGGLFHNSKDPYVRRSNRRLDESETNVIVRIPLGIEWLPSNVPLGVFVEIVPGVVIIPEVEAEFMGGVGIRYYF